jgi:hypothetical protein
MQKGAHRGWKFVATVTRPALLLVRAYELIE